MIKQWINKCGWTIDQAADAAGIGRNMLYKVLAGHRKLRGHAMQQLREAVAFRLASTEDREVMMAAQSIVDRYCPEDQ